MMPATPGDLASTVELAGIAPTAARDRISLLDVLRGVAVLGILLMNITAFGLPYWAYDDPSVVGGATGANLVAWVVTNVFFEGTMRAMFSLLFGAGVILLTSRLEARQAAMSTDADGFYFRRNLWLILFGVVHAYILLWVGDILYVYGIVGLFLYVFRRMSPRGLLLMSALMFAIVMARTLIERHEMLSVMAAARDAEVEKALGHDLTTEQHDAIEEWNDQREEFKPDQEDIDGEIKDLQAGYFELMLAAAPINARLQSTGLYKGSFWDAASMMFLGMGLMKLGVLTGARSRNVYLTMMLVGYGLGLAVNVYETTIILRGDFSIEAFAQASLTYDLGRVAMVFGHLRLIMLILKAGAFGWLTARLAAVGQMALTNYLMQSVLCGLFFYGCGLGFFGHLQRWQLYLVVLAIWITQIALSPLWLQRFQFGPAEWLWRSLTYWKRQRMLRIDAPPTTHPVV